MLANGGPGGMQRQVALLANGLAHRGHDVTVVVGGDEAVGGIDLERVALIRLQPFRGRSGGMAFVRALRKLVDRLHPDVLHGHGLRLAMALRLAQHSTPMVLVTSHGIDPAVVSGLRLPLRIAGIAVASCGEAPKQLLQAIGIASTILPVGIEPAPLPKSRHDVAQRFGIPEVAKVAVSAIRLSDQKDPSTMVEAVALVEHLHLVLFGDGPLLEHTRLLAHSLHVEDRIHFAGFSNEVRAWMAAGDVVVLSSKWEGHVLVALEAMAANVPLVATACPGIVEWVRNGDSALLSPIGDAQSLGQNLRRVLNDNVLVTRLVAAGAQVSTTHTSEAMVDAHLAAYGTSAG